MDPQKAFDKQWADLEANSTPGMKDIAYTWFLEGWNLSQETGRDILIDKVIGFLNRMKSNIL